MSNASLVGAPIASSARFPELHTRFETYFRTQQANSPELLKSAFSLRYQVYCVEREFENAEHYEDQLEADAFDGYSLNGLIFHNPRNEAIGTVRLILPERSSETLPIQSILGKLGIDATNYFPLDKTAEVSRFAISREFRRRYSNDRLGDQDNQFRPGIERGSSLPCLGLIQLLVEMGLTQGISYWAALMEPKLLRMLKTMGIHFHPIGPLISHHGIRQPAFCHVPTMIEQLFRERPDHWDVVTAGGSLSYHALAAAGHTGLLGPVQLRTAPTNALLPQSAK